MTENSAARETKAPMPLRLLEKLSGCEEADVIADASAVLASPGAAASSGARSTLRVRLPTQSMKAPPGFVARSFERGEALAGTSLAPLTLNALCRLRWPNVEALAATSAATPPFAVDIDSAHAWATLVAEEIRRELPRCAVGVVLSAVLSTASYALAALLATPKYDH